MEVVPATMTVPVICGKRQPAVFFYWQSVHISAEHDRFPRLFPSNYANNTAFAYFLVRYAVLSKLFRYKFRRNRKIIPYFGVAMEEPSVPYHFFFVINRLL